MSTKGDILPESITPPEPCRVETLPHASSAAVLAALAWVTQGLGYYCFGSIMQKETKSQTCPPSSIRSSTYHYHSSFFSQTHTHYHPGRVGAGRQQHSRQAGGAGRENGRVQTGAGRTGGRQGGRQAESLAGIG